MLIAAPAETDPEETRVAATPETVKKFVGLGAEVAIEHGAGAKSGFPDAEYTSAGARLVSAEEAFGADLVLKVRRPTANEIARLKPDAIVIATMDPYGHRDPIEAMAKAGAAAFAMELLPRITRAQVMDVLSSQANLAGYRAVIDAAAEYGRALPMMMTPAGTVPAAKLFVMGVGVAGLQSIATARRLGAVVKAYDVRAAAKEEAESLGATFVDTGVSAEGTGGYARELTPEELDRQRAALAEEVRRSDVVITTAAVPGRKAPVLVTTAMVEGMAPGAIVVDMAADQGGNCELTKAGEVVEHNGVHIVGMTNPPAGMPTHASFLFSRNVANVLGLMGPEGSLTPDWDDEIVAGMCVLRDGAAVAPAAVELLGDQGAPSQGAPA